MEVAVGKREDGGRVRMEFAFPGRSCVLGNSSLDITVQNTYRGF